MIEHSVTALLDVHHRVVLSLVRQLLVSDRDQVWAKHVLDFSNFMIFRDPAQHILQLSRILVQIYMQVLLHFFIAHPTVQFQHSRQVLHIGFFAFARVVKDFE